MKPQTHILFVCLGNICRSPMAEYIMRHKIQQADLNHQIVTDSAGTSGWHDGEDMHKGTKQQLAKHNIDNSGFVSRRVQKQDWEKFDYIIAMDNQNLKDLEKLFGKEPNRLFNITSLCHNLAYDHIPDPWYTDNFDETYQLLGQCCEVLLQRVKG
ncbi:low molecular weight protein-tyrosine-phosphatase [Phocoenobacter skyensis]|uniref:protein-tyrosine-phosphatase n=1 Tax=Phocoenobacter skyensis TaxID=97481 RepID=A0A1H7WDV3_9PAST|nr:low molecular weight protein-tyrosine-phosphatase [Pasteurella skyensis]MDP8079188.1 low molecular weight protein-tyrosine-phosphatase [Pasteurella skyensis]MDP8085202.1 low molecular weight protein-tyrosine-phosphatase [Pasteurella skyensis]MDP8185118.1 low molecular weight protein-tyrosine-phosphatase [Pasteurella skyensis]QLB22198.1 protein-tyrosine-phosphatase [Pasteurella skyensis]SEM19703.1 protein-tyrosine phosphatase [Pasteurella skyensis]